MLLVLWLPKHYDFHVTVLLLCITVIRKLWQQSCMKHLKQLINVTVSHKNCMASVKLNTLKSTLSLNSLPNSYLIITKHPNYTKCKVHYIYLLSYTSPITHTVPFKLVPSMCPAWYHPAVALIGRFVRNQVFLWSTSVKESATEFLKFLYRLCSRL